MHCKNSAHGRLENYIVSIHDLIAGIAPNQGGPDISLHVADDHSIRPVWIDGGVPALEVVCNNWDDMHGMYGPGGPTRAEVMRYDSKPWGATRDYWFEVMIPQDWVMSTYPITSIFDCHTRNDAADAGENGSPLEACVVGNEIVWTTSFDVNATSVAGSSAPVTLCSNKFTFGVPVLYHIKVKFAWDNTGYILIERNGVKVAERTGPNCYNDAISPYAKCGIYQWRWSWPDTNPPICDTRKLYLLRFDAAYS